MSYTMTFDFPQRTANYVERQGERFRDELNALVVAIISTKMQYDSETVAEPTVTTPKNDFSGFFGKAKLEGDAVAIQRSLREEW